MNQRHSIAFVGGAATVLGAIPLSAIFSSFTWLIYTIMAVAAIVGTAMAVRSARGPVWAQVLAMTGALLVYLVIIFPSGGEILRIIPTGETFRHFNALFVQAGERIRNEAVPVGDFDGLLLLTTAGVGLVAILVDFFAVGIRRPALAGLPMLAIYSVPVAVLSTSVSVFTFAFAAAGYLWLLVADSVERVRRFGRRFTGEGRDVDVWEPSPLSAAGRRLGVVGVVVAILLPLAVPGLTTSLVDGFGTGNRPGTGAGGNAVAPSVDLFALLRGNLSRDETFPMVEVTTNDPAPYYLRFGVADRATPNGFTNRAPDDGESLRDLPDNVPPQRDGVTAERFRAKVKIIALNMQLAPTYRQLVGVNGLDGSWVFDAASELVYSRRSSIDKQEYEFDYVRVGYTQNALRQAPPLGAAANANLRRYLEVPVDEQVTELVRDLVEDETTQYDRVRAIYNHFSPSNGFTYSTDTEDGTNGNPIIDFLENKRGFCVQYAAALTWLVRAAGYPARVAFGFTRGAAPRAGVYTLTSANLHAWTEVYFPDFGWVPFDATPAAPVVGSVTPAWAPDLTQPEPTIDPSIPDGGTAAPRPSGGPAPGLDEGDGSSAGDVPGSASAVNQTWLIGVAIAAIAIVALLAPSLQRRTVRRRRRSRSGDTVVLDPGDARVPEDEVVLDLDPNAVATARRDAHEAWAELVDTMIDFNVPVDPAETPRATAERIGTMPAMVPGSKDHARLLARAEERARYAPVPLRPDRLDEAAQALRAAFNERATGRQRILATFLPPSVLLRWRADWEARMARAVATSARVQEALLSINPRRLLANRRTRTTP